MARKSPEELRIERSYSSQTLTTTGSIQLWRGVKRRTRIGMSLLYFTVMAGIVVWSVLNQPPDGIHFMPFPSILLDS